MSEREYAVFYKHDSREPWRGPWPKKKCEDWIRVCKDDGMDVSVFWIEVREVSPWKKIVT